MQAKITNILSNIFLDIVSVIIGISIAFWLDNWNEQKNKNILEKNTLLEIKNALILDLKDLSVNYNGHKRNLIYCDSLFSHVEKNNLSIKDKAQFKKLISSLFREYLITPNLTGYETLKNRGIDLIKDDSLRTKIMHLYGFTYPSIVKLEETYEPSKLNKHLIAVNDYLINKKIFELDEFILNKIYDAYISHKFLADFYFLTQKDVNELIAEIDLILNSNAS